MKKFLIPVLVACLIFPMAMILTGCKGDSATLTNAQYVEALCSVGEFATEDDSGAGITSFVAQKAAVTVGDEQNGDWNVYTVDNMNDLLARAKESAGIMSWTLDAIADLIKIGKLDPKVEFNLFKITSGETVTKMWVKLWYEDNTVHVLTSTRTNDNPEDEVHYCKVVYDFKAKALTAFGEYVFSPDTENIGYYDYVSAYDYDVEAEKLYRIVINTVDADNLEAYLAEQSDAYNGIHEMFAEYVGLFTDDSAYANATVI